jgi:hypothetical protein
LHRAARRIDLSRARDASPRLRYTIPSTVLRPPPLLVAFLGATLAAGCIADWTVPPRCQCTAAAPAGWSGPVALLSQPGAEPPSCEGFGTAVYAGNADLVAEPATCGCSCGALDASCPGATVDLFAYTMDPCGFSGTACHLFGHTVMAGECASIDAVACGTEWGINVVTPAAAVGSCPPAPTADVPAWSWGTAVAACQAETSTCSGGEQCVPAGGASCIYHADEVDCPDGPYGERRLVYAGVDDQRGCTACTCAPDDTDCSGTITTYGDSQCSTNGQSFPAPLTSCTNVDAAMQVIYLAYQAMPVGTSCTPSSSDPVGVATAQQASTFCCLP